MIYDRRVDWFVWMPGVIIIDNTFHRENNQGDPDNTKPNKLAGVEWLIINKHAN